jgi:hypothetical protein
MIAETLDVGTGCQRTNLNRTEMFDELESLVREEYKC